MEDLVKKINQEIKNHIDPKIKADFMGIAETAIIREDVREAMMPALVRPDGQARAAFYDDRLDLTIYHRITGKTYETHRNAGYGDAPSLDAIYEMTLTACGRRARVNQYELERTCSRTIADFKAQGLTLTPIRSNFNRTQIWSQEYSGLRFPLELPIFLFNITYRVKQRQTPCT